jgi:23S rRNA (uracil1939-C5)-methyltransferase
MRLTIEKVIYGGSGLARSDQGVVFVPRTAPGDVVDVEITTRKKDYSVAQVTGIVEPSPDRQSPLCEAGCCHWQHMRYDRQVHYKEEIIRESIGRLGHFVWDGSIDRVTGPDRNYRLRAAFHVIDGRFGFMRENTHTVIPIRECASLVPEINQFIQSTDPVGAAEVHVVSTPAVAATFVFQDGSIKRSGRATIHVGNLQYRISAETFFQANRFLLVPMINEVVQQVGTAPRHVLELYSGVGFFSVPLSQIATEVIAVEESGHAVRQARESAGINDRGNLRFVEGRVDATLQEARVKPDVVVLDPPRAGCGVKVAKKITEVRPNRIVYVSCNPSTFAREAAVFVSRGYDLRRLTLVDQFPNTYHIEMVSSFVLK